MSILSKQNFITFGITVLGTMVGCMVAPKVMAMVTKKDTPKIDVPPVVEGEAV